MEITKADWKARVPSLSSWFSKPGDSIAIIDNITITFYVLFGNYSSKGVFAHRCGCHFIDHKMTVCSEIEEAGPCQICERIRTMKAAGAPAADIFRISAPPKFAFNVVIHGEEVPKVLFIPESAARPIIEAFDAGFKEDINIFDPLCTIPWTLCRTKENGRTVYHVAPDARIRPGPIITGDNIEARIEKILKSGANFDVRYRLPFQP
jgi:hypothetical protein